MKNKPIIFLILIGVFGLTACGSSNQTSNSGSNNNSNNQNNNSSNIELTGLTHELQLTDNDILQHVDYSISWSSTSSEYYVQEYAYYTYVYKTTLKITIDQVRKGFVAYNGTSEISFSFEWDYSVDYQACTNSVSVQVPLTLSDSKLQTNFEKEFEYIPKRGESNIPGSKIPYCPYGSTKPSVKKVVANRTNMKATYYHYGISGGTSLCYETYAVTTVNYTYYLKIYQYGVIRGHNSSSYICPIDTNEMFDYRITAIVGGEKVTISRDGYYVFDKILEDLTITNVEGFIDVYPGRVI